MMDSFFIGGSFGSSDSQGAVDIINGNVIANIPLDLYIDGDENVYAGRSDNNASLIFISKDEIYARKVV